MTINRRQTEMFSPKNNYLSPWEITKRVNEEAVPAKTQHRIEKLANAQIYCFLVGDLVLTFITLTCFRNTSVLTVR